MSTQLSAKGKFLPKYLNMAVCKMCDVINVDPGTVNFDDPLWFSSHSWTEEQEMRFKEWFIDLLSTDRKARRELMSTSYKSRKAIEQCWSLFNLMYGWPRKQCPKE